MAEVIHRYIRRGEPLPEPSKEQKEREESDARFAAARAKKEEALATLREAEVLRKRRELISRDTATKQASSLCQLSSPASSMCRTSIKPG
jgi:hypothetical protein